MSTQAEFIFLGTGPSSSLPNIECLTAPPSEPQCPTCLSALTPQGWKNKRRNTSAVYRVRDRNGVLRTVLIDVGKTFQAAALDWFPKHGLRRIDALLLTHAHADAMNGLDDLRAWTLRGTIQAHIDIYLSADTFNEVGRAFPYLVKKEYATGGGDVPEFKFHIIQEKIPFEVGGDTGIWVTPFAVHHGRIFSTSTSNSSAPAYLPTPTTTAPPTPVGEASASTPTRPASLVSRLTASLAPSVSVSVSASADPRTHTTPQKDRNEKIIQPYVSYGFVLQRDVVYISDVSFIPEETWEVLLNPPALPSVSIARNSSPIQYRYPLLVIDTLRAQPHMSHFGVTQAVGTARRLGSVRAASEGKGNGKMKTKMKMKTYTVGGTHELTHAEWVGVGEALGRVGLVDDEVEVEAGSRAGGGIVRPERVRETLEYIRRMGELDLDAGGEEDGLGEGIWIRPAFDGLRVVIDNEAGSGQRRIAEDGYGNVSS